MASNNAVVLSEANLDILENNLSTLANNLGDLTDNITEVDGKVSSVTQTVKTLEEEIKTFMMEIRESTIISNAKQTVLMSERELDKKYGHYDNVRRTLSGILQSTDINAIRKQTLESLSEQTLISTPNYWLSPALVALCAWFTNNKVLANKALNEALKRDDEKTSLLFCLIHLRAKRNETAVLWLKRYLNKQNPLKMESKFITVLDAISSGIFGSNAKSLVIIKIKEWLKIINSKPEIKLNQKNRWNQKFESLTIQNQKLIFPYLEKYTTSSNIIKNSFNKTTSRQNIYDYLNNITKETNTNLDITKKIDNIINLLIYNYEKEELELKREIEKNKLIINEKGNLKIAENKYKTTLLSLQEETDIYTILNNIVLEDYVETFPETKKLALSLIKESVIEAWNEYSLKENMLSINNEIKINNWSNNTIDGKNERELKESLKQHIQHNNKSYINSESFINIKVMIAFIIIIISCFLLRNYPQFIIMFIGLGIAYIAFEIFNIYKRRNIKISKVQKETETSLEILENIICEIVDYNYMIKETNLINENIKTFLNNLNYENYINSSEIRNIIVGE